MNEGYMYAQVDSYLVKPPGSSGIKATIGLLPGMRFYVQSCTVAIDSNDSHEWIQADRLKKRIQKHLDRRFVGKWKQVPKLSG
jgi:hypothetical protein